MDKTTYIHLRNTNQVQQIAFNHYKEKGGTYDFQTCMDRGAFSLVNMDELIEELDKRFGVTLVMFNERLIKVQ